MFVISASHTQDDAEKFKSELQVFIEKVESLKPEIDLWDLRNFNFTIYIELQTWIDENIDEKAFNLGVKRVVMVLSEDIIDQLAVEQTMGEKDGYKLTVRFFSDYDEAMRSVMG